MHQVTLEIFAPGFVAHAEDSEKVSFSVEMTTRVQGVGHDKKQGCDKDRANACGDESPQRPAAIEPTRWVIAAEEKNESPGDRKPKGQFVIAAEDLRGDESNEEASKGLPLPKCIGKKS